MTIEPTRRQHGRSLPAWNEEGLTGGLRMLYAAGKLEVRRADDGRLILRRLGVPDGPVARMDQRTRAWTMGAESGVGFVSLARRLGLELEDGLAPWLREVLR